MSSVTVTENNNKVSVDKTTNVVTVTSPGTVGPQGGSGTIDSATATASAVAVSGAGASGTPTATVTLGGTASARTMAFAFGVPTGASGVIGSIVTTGTDGISVDSGGTMNSFASTIQLGINAQTLWTHILGADVTGTALTVSDGSNTSPIVLEGTITFAAVANETTVAESAGTITIGLVDNPTVSGNLIVSGNLTVSGTTTTVDTTVTISDAVVVNNAGSDVGIKVNSTSSGHIMQLQDNGSDVLVVADGGTTTATAFAGPLTGNVTGNADTVTTNANLTGDVTSSGNATTIASDVIVNADVKTDAAIAISKTALVGGTGLTLSTNTLNVDASQTQITSVGTIGTGTWEGTTVAVAQGGTGVTSKTGTGNVVLSTSPTLVTPALGTPASGVATNLTGTASGLTAGTVTTNANLTGDVTSSGNATAIASDVIVNADVKSDAAIAMSKTALVGGTGLTLSTNTLNVDAAQTQITSVGTIGTGTWEGTTVAVAQGGTGVTSKTGTGNVVLHTSPTLVTPALGTPDSGVMTNVTGTASGLTAGAATVATEATNITAVANNATDETTYPTFVDGATGTQGIETDTGLTYNPSSGLLTAAGFAGPITGAVTGNAATATALATGRTIGMTGDVVWTSASFDGSGNVTGSATIQANSVALGTDTTGDYTATVTAGTGLTSTGATSGESIAHSLSVDASQTQITSVGTIGTGTWQGTAVAQTYVANEAINEAKLQVSNAPTNGYALIARSAATGDMTWEDLGTSFDTAGTGVAMAIALG